jgi:hypothetical protein
MAQNADSGNRAPSEMRADVCPICGGPNECGGAAGKDPCWCSTVAMSREALAAVPADAREHLHLPRMRTAGPRGLNRT